MPSYEYQQSRNYFLFRGKCDTCPWRPPVPSLLHVHHVLPRHLGGGDEEENLVCLCPNCHAVAHWLLRQGNEFPARGGKQKLRQAIRETRTQRRLDNNTIRGMREEGLPIENEAEMRAELQKMRFHEAR